MSSNTTTTANEILNRVAAEVGFAPTQDPYAAVDPFYVQLRYLMQTAGEELMHAFPWEVLQKTYTVTTVDGDTGRYDTPSDFAYVINDTAWDRTNNTPLGGPLSPKDWAYLKGRDLSSNTLYASFRFDGGTFNIFPENPAAGIELSFGYVSTHWVNEAPTTVTKDSVTVGTDIILFDKTLFTRSLKVKYLEAGGFDTTKAQADLNQIFAFLTGTDKGAPILNAGGRGGRYPYLSAHNSPDTGFGGGTPA